MPFWGFSLWDMIQPAFMFMVGVAAPYSFANRQAKGDSYLRMFGHACWRALVLVLMGVFLSSNGSSQTNWAFMNVLSQIGLGYLFVFLLINRPLALQIGAIAVILAGHWFAYFQNAVPPESEWAQLGLTEKFITDGGTMPGIMAHWNEHTNLGGHVDRWFLNLFPRSEPFVSNNGGYQTINFVSAIATMLLGLMIGEWLRSSAEPRAKLQRMLIVGAALIAAGVVLHFACCPIIKRIWTPSWALYSGGVVIWMLAALYAVIDIAGWKRWSFPLVVVGMNSIAIYMMSQMMRGFTLSSLRTHLRVPYEALAAWINERLAFSWPGSIDTLLGKEFLYAPIVERCLVLFVFWLVCYWMYRQKIFLRV
jgi:predicted acyltransferase